MAECVRCGDFTDNPSEGDYHYCEDCLNRFSQIESSGVIIEQDGANGEYHVIVTDGTASLDGGSEDSQEGALARGKYISDECGVEALFKYENTKSRWILDEYLQAHPDIRQDVHERLRRVPDQTSDGFLSRIKSFL